MAGIHLIEKKRRESREPIPLRPALRKCTPAVESRKPEGTEVACGKHPNGIVARLAQWVAELSRFARAQEGEFRLMAVEGGRSGRCSLAAGRGQGSTRPFLVLERMR